MEQRTPRGPGFTLAMLLAIIMGVVLFLSIHLMRPPRPEPENAPRDHFSAQRAFRHLEAIAGQPRPVGSPHHDFSRQYIRGQLMRIGLETQVQEKQSPRSWKLANVVARLPGRRPGSAILLMAHYDSVNASPGAADDGVGVAALLEAARALAAGPHFERPVILLFSDGEEMGLQGASLFLRSHPWAREVSLVLNLDCMGRGPALMFETSPGNRLLVREFARAAVRPFASSLMVSIYRSMPNSTDLSVFLEAGIPGLNFTAIGGNQFYHLRGDNLARVDRNTLQHFGATTLSLVRHFGSLSSNQRSARDAVYFNLLGPLFVHYSESLNPWLLAFLLLLFVAALAMGLRRGALTPSGMVKSFILGWLALLLVLTVTVLAWLAIDAVHGLLHHPGNVQKNACYYVFFIGLAAVLMTACLARLVRPRKGLTPSLLQVGAVGSWSLLAGLAVLALPGGSYLLLWPALAGCLGLWLSLGPVSERHPRLKGVLTAFLAALPSLLLFAPLLYLLFFNQGVSLYSAAGIGLGMGLVTWLAAPALEATSWLRSRIPALAAGLVLLGTLAGGAVHSRNLRLYPQWCNLHYIVDQNREKAFWMISGSDRHPWARRFSAKAIPGSPYDRSAMVGVDRGYQPTVCQAEPSPGVRVEGDRREGDNRRLRLRITPPPGAMMMEIDAPRAAIAWAAIDGETVLKAAGRPPSRFYRILYNPPEEGFDLELEMRADAALTLTLIAHRPGLPSGPAAKEMDRPSELLPIGWGDTVTVIKTFTF